MRAQNKKRPCTCRETSSWPRVPLFFYLFFSCLGGGQRDDDDDDSNGISNRGGAADTMAAVARARECECEHEGKNSNSNSGAVEATTSVQWVNLATATTATADKGRSDGFQRRGGQTRKPQATSEGCALRPAAPTRKRSAVSKHQQSSATQRNATQRIPQRSRRQRQGVSVGVGVGVSTAYSTMYTAKQRTCYRPAVGLRPCPSSAGTAALAGARGMLPAWVWVWVWAALACIDTTKQVLAGFAAWPCLSHPTDTVRRRLLATASLGAMAI